MNISEGFSGRVYKTKTRAFNYQSKRIDEIMKGWSGSEIDVIYENLIPIVVIVFESREDCLAFKLKHGDDYV